MNEDRNINKNHRNGNFIMKKNRKNVFLFVTANKHEKDAFEKNLYARKSSFTHTRFKNKETKKKQHIFWTGLSGFPHIFVWVTV